MNPTDRDEMQADCLQQFENNYQLIRKIAQVHKGKNISITLDATEIAHEVLIQLSRKAQHEVNDTAHFTRLVSQAIRWIILDYIKHKQSQKRGANQSHENIDQIEIAAPEHFPDWILFDQALTKLEQLDPLCCRVVESRTLLGYSVKETAQKLNSSTATIKRKWQFSRAWLANYLESNDE